MPDLVSELASQARSFPVEERSRLVDLLPESLHESPIAEVEAAWAKEIERRLVADFPFKLVYTQTDFGILIHAVAGDHQLPEYWLRRIHRNDV